MYKPDVVSSPRHHLDSLRLPLRLPLVPPLLFLQKKEEMDLSTFWYKKKLSLFRRDVFFFLNAQLSLGYKARSAITNSIVMSL